MVAQEQEKRNPPTFVDYQQARNTLDSLNAQTLIFPLNGNHFALNNARAHAFSTVRRMQQELFDRNRHPLPSELRIQIYHARIHEETLARLEFQRYSTVLARRTGRQLDVDTEELETRIAATKTEFETNPDLQLGYNMWQAILQNEPITPQQPVVIPTIATTFTRTSPEEPASPTVRRKKSSRTTEAPKILYRIPFSVEGQTIYVSTQFAPDAQTLRSIAKSGGRISNGLLAIVREKTRITNLLTRHGLVLVQDQETDFLNLKLIPDEQDPKKESRKGIYTFIPLGKVVSIVDQTRKYKENKAIALQPTVTEDQPAETPSPETQTLAEKLFQIPEEQFALIITRLSPNQREIARYTRLYTKTENIPIRDRVLAEIVYGGEKVPVDVKLSRLRQIINSLNNKLESYGYILRRTSKKNGTYSFSELTAEEKRLLQERRTQFEAQRQARQAAQEINEHEGENLGIDLEPMILPKDVEVELDTPFVRNEDPVLFNAPDALVQEEIVCSNGNIMEPLLEQYRTASKRKNQSAVWRIREVALLTTMTEPEINYDLLRIILGRTREQVIRTVMEIIDQATLAIWHGGKATPNQHILKSYLLSDLGRSMLHELYKF